MENALENKGTENLITELASWNRQENQFRSLFSDEALKDREFMKMKLSAYDRIWDKYNGKAQTTDEKAMLLMLRFQRRKMSKVLYPGLLTRFVRRGIRSLVSFIVRRRERALEQRQQQPYAYHTIRVNGSNNDVNGQSTATSHQDRQQQRFGQDLGSRHKNNNHQRKGHSL
jgi:hypothetical protein